MRPGKLHKTPEVEASGPVVVWCSGQRCTALHRLKGIADDRYERLRSTVRTTPGALLITSPCLGRCELASLVSVGRRHGPTGQIGPMAWFAGVEDRSLFEALLTWISSGGPQLIHRPQHALPSTLGLALCGIGPPPNIYQQ